VLLLGGLGLVLSSSSAPTKGTPGVLASVSAVPSESNATSGAASVPTAPAAPIEVVIRIETTPPKAHVFVAGEDHGVSPVDLRLLRSSEVTEVELRRDGYVTQVEKVTPETDQKLKLTLIAVPVRGAAPPPPPKPSASANPYRRFD